MPLTELLSGYRNNAIRAIPRTARRKTAQVGEDFAENAMRMPRDAPLALWLTIALVAISGPHAAEDFQYGEFTRLGVVPAWGAIALGAVYGAQVLGAYLAGRRNRCGVALLIAGGAAWCRGVAIVHGPEILGSGDYRHGLISKGLKMGIIWSGAVTAVVGSFEWRRVLRKRTPE